MPAVSIILMCNEPSVYFDACLRGILAQALTDFEVLCVQEPCNSEAVCGLERLVADDRRFAVIDTSDGATPLWREALGRATAPFVYLMDASTLLEPHALERLCALAECLDLDVAIANGSVRAVEGDDAEELSCSQSIRVELLPLHEAFSADEASQQLVSAVPLRSWDRLYRREWLMDVLPEGPCDSPVCDIAFALAVLVLAHRIDWLDDLSVRYESVVSASADEMLDQLKLAHQLLVGAGLYERYERGFLNHAAHLLLNGLSDTDAAEQQAWRGGLHEVWDTMGFAGKNRDFFYQGDVYDSLLEQLSWSTPCVTVLMPSLNVAAYIRQCVESVLAQTLRSIEVLCIDAGSTDGTLEILREYERADARVRVILSDKRSYGYQMNLGLAVARGEYIGIVETDDYADPEMFETLYRQAKRLDAQVVKSNYYIYHSRPVDKSVYYQAYWNMPYDCLLTRNERIEAVRRIPCIWTGIYQTKMLRDNGIDFLETPGASYQDTAFTLKVWTTVDRVALNDRAFLHYRIDNEASSVKQADKAYFVNGEFQNGYEYCVRRHGSKDGYTASLRCRQANAYNWNFGRIDDGLKRDYIMHIREEFAVARDAGELERRYFWRKEWDFVQQVLNDPEALLASRSAEELANDEDSGPLLTLIVNACGFDRTIGLCAESAAGQDLSDVEVAFVDDLGSQEVTRELAAHAGENEACVTLQSKGATLASLLRDAVGRARGMWLFFVEGNVAFEPDALKKVKACLAASAADAVLFKYDTYDIEQNELVTRQQGVDLGARGSLKPINAQNDARSLLQIASPHVTCKAFRRSMVEREGLSFLEYGCNCDIAFCELGLLGASAVEVGPNAGIDVLLGAADPRVAALRANPREAVESWLELFEMAERAGLYDAYTKTLVNAAASQLADDMEDVRSCIEARAALCEAMAGERVMARGIACHDRAFYANERVYSHMRGIVLADEFARIRAGKNLSDDITRTHEVLNPEVREAVSAVGAVCDELLTADAGGRQTAKSSACVQEGLIERAAHAMSDSEDAVEFLHWRLPDAMQRALDQLVYARVRDQRRLNESVQQVAELQHELEVLKHQLVLTERELAVEKGKVRSRERDLKAQKKKAAKDIKSAEDAVRASRSYRLGNALGAPVRAVRSVRNRLAGE